LQNSEPAFMLYVHLDARPTEADDIAVKDLLHDIRWKYAQHDVMQYTIQ